MGRVGIEGQVFGKGAEDVCTSLRCYVFFEAEALNVAGDYLLEGGLVGAVQFFGYSEHQGLICQHYS